MSIIKSLQDWLGEYEYMHIKKLSEIRTDILDENSGSYAIVPSGNGKTVTDIIGNCTYINNYVFYARESLLDEADRVGTNDFLEALQEWIELKAEAEAYPKLKGRYSVNDIYATNAMLFDVNEDGTGIYQVQITVEIDKRRKEN